MTNREKFKEEICDIVIDRNLLAVSMKLLKPCKCSMTKCSDCIANNNTTSCQKVMREWANSEYVEPCLFEKDELVEVSQDGKFWVLRYFSHMAQTDSKYVVFMNGLKSTEATYRDLCNYNYCQKYGTLGGLVKENGNETKS